MAVRSKRPRSPEVAAIRYATDLKGWGLDDLAEAMRQHTGEDKWTVDMLERIVIGRRLIRTDELAPLSDVLEIPVSFLVRGVKVTARYPAVPADADASLVAA